jgi:hypothetical protein
MSSAAVVEVGGYDGAVRGDNEHASIVVKDTCNTINLCMKKLSTVNVNISMFQDIFGHLTDLHRSIYDLFSKVNGKNGYRGRSRPQGVKKRTEGGGGRGNKSRVRFYDDTGIVGTGTSEDDERVEKTTGIRASCGIACGYSEDGGFPSSQQQFLRESDVVKIRNPVRRAPRKTAGPRKPRSSKKGSDISGSSGGDQGY